jgi:predicted  nucleic acid-binding Zn-ribbon protein
MSHTIASDLPGLHTLHQRAKALRDRLETGPKTLAARKKGVEAKQKALEEARNALKQKKSDISRRETLIGSARARVDDLRLKLNQTKKNEEYKLITNQIATDNKNISRQEEEVLELMMAMETQTAALATLEAETAKSVADFEKLRADFESKADGYRSQLKELEASIIDSESIIPEDDRDRYRRSVRGRGDDAFAAVDPANPACSGCYLSVTAQGVNELMLASGLVFCKTCGRILYIAD